MSRTSLGRDLGGRPPMKRRNLLRARSSRRGHRRFRALFFPPATSRGQGAEECAQIDQRARDLDATPGGVDTGSEPPASIIVSESRIALASPLLTLLYHASRGSSPELNARRRGVRVSRPAHALLAA